MTAKHTPGPWTVRDVSWSDDGYACFEVLPIKQVGIADARLIAAAPEMLEVLKRVLRRCSMSDGMREEIDAALSKAEGRE